MFKATKSFRFIVVIIAIFAVSTLAIAANWGSGYGLGLFGTSETAANVSPEGTTAPVEPTAPMFAPVTTNGGSGLAGTYPDLATAITALNAATITSPVVITVTGTETAPPGGYVITQLGGTASNTITIDGTDPGSTTITAGLQVAAGTAAAASFDAIFKINGGDYITIQNFTMAENAGNTVLATGATNTMTEFGVLLVHASATDGAQNNTIKGNAISLNSAYPNSAGIFSTSSSDTANATLDATSTAGTNSNNKFYGNTISNVAQGMLFICPPITATVFETGIDVGGSSAATANTITFGNATASSGPWNRSQSTVQAGIYFRNGAGNSVRFNSVTSNSAAYVGSGGLNGIMISSGTAPVGVTYTSTISDNTVNLTTTGIALMTGVDFGHGIATGTIAGSNNNVTLTQTGAVTNAAAVIGVKGNYASATATANTNTVTFNQTFTPIAAAQTNSSAFTGVTISGTSTTLNANSNIINVTQLVNPGTTITAATLSGQMTCVTATGAANTVNTNSNQITVSQTAQPGGTTATAVISSLVLGVNSSIAGNAGAVYSANYNSVTVNQASNITASGAATASITGQFNGIQVGGNNAASGATNVLGNTVLLTRSVSQVAGQTTTLGGSSTAFIGISATTATTTLTVGSASVTADQNTVQVREGTSANGTVTYQAGSVTMLNLGSSSATTTSPASVANVLGNRLNTGSTLATTTGSTIRCTGTFSGITIPNQGSLNTVSGNQIIVDRVASGGSVFGYNQSTAPSELADTVTNNTITFTSLAGSAAPTGISALGGTSTTAKTVTGNTVSISGTHTGTSTGYATNFSGGNVSTNSFTINSASPTVVGINLNGSSGSGAYTVNANTLNLNSTTTSPTSMIGINGAVSGPFTVTNNIFNAMNFTGIITGSPVISGVVIAVGTGNVVSNNTITNISVGAATSTATPTVDGVLISGGSGVNVFKNNIYGITTGATGATTIVNGIRISGGGLTNPNNVFNNLIGNLTAGASTNTDSVRGIGITSTSTTTTNNVYYNTVFLSGGGGTNFGSSGIFHATAGSVASTTATLNLRNNIIVNNTTPNGTGLAVAFRRSAGTAGALANYASTSNNNDFYAGTPGASNLIYSDGTSSAQTMAAYKAGVFTAGTIAPRDSGSITENPNFLSTNGALSTFLHINPAIASQLESGAVNISGITDDFDAQVRAGNPGYPSQTNGGGSAPDIGADEYDGILQDLTGPAITYTNLGNTSCLTPPTLTATITDASLVNTTAGGKPRLYYRRSTSNNAFVGNTSADNGWKYVVASNAASPFTFTPDYSIMFGGAPTTLDVIQYFVVAADLAGTPNVGINAGTFVGATPTTVDLQAQGVTSIGGTPASYTLITPGLSGTVTIGAAGTYPSLTGATGLFADINTKGLSGALTVNILDASVGETGATVLNAINYNGCAAGPYAVLIKPDTGVTSTLTGSFASGLITLNAADSVTIDGSNNGTTSRDLTITNTNAGTSSAVVWLQSNGIDGATGNTIKNVNIVGNSNVTTLFGIGMGSSAIGLSSLGTNNNTNTIQNNNISKTQYGIYSQGASAAAKNTGNIITQNLMNTASPNNIRQGGILVGFENNITISANTVDGISHTSDCFGIAVGLPSIATSTNSGSEVTNATVSNNIIGTVANTGGFGAAGITLASATSGTTTIANNVITGVGGTATPSDFNAGMILGGGTGSATRVYFNSVSMTGTFASGSSPIFAIAVIASNPVLDIRNNAFFNTQTTSSGVRYAIGLGYPAPYTNLTINNNDYFTSTLGTAGSFATSASANSVATPVAATTLAAFITATSGSTGNDSASISSNPSFNSLTDLRPQLGSTLVGAGVIGTGVTTDILAVSRSGSAPTIGAYENAVDVAGPTISYTAFGNTTSTSNRTLTVSVTDASGVPTSGTGLPRVYFNKNAGAYSNSQCVFTSGSSYDCLIDYTPLGGVVATDTIRYYVAAQDSAGTPNVSVFPSAGASGLTANPPAATTPPTTPSSYLIATALAGAYSVNAGGGGAATSLTNPGGIFEFINNNVVVGDVVIDIDSDLTAETGAVALNDFGPSFNIFIFPKTVARTISGTSVGSTGLIKLNGADRVTIDGSRANTLGTGLTITNLNASGVVIWIASAGAANPAVNDRIQFCNISGSGSTGTIAGIIAGSGTTLGSAAEAANSNNTIQFNTITKVQNGAFISGLAATGDANWDVRGNTFGSTVATDKLGFRGLFMGNTSSMDVRDNTITGVSSSASTSSTMSGIQVSGLTVNGQIRRNKISDIKQTNTTGWGSNGIFLASSSAASGLLVFNNFISDVASQGFNGITASDNGYGIMVDNTGGGYRIYHNTVNLNTNQGSGAAAGITAAINLGTTVPVGAVDLRNNILMSSQTLGTRYGVVVQGATTAFSTINYNDYFAQNVGRVVGTTHAGLAAWQGATGGDANSLSVDPLLVSSTDLHLQAGSPLVNAGTTSAIGGVGDDIDGDTRPSGSATDIGADEIIESADLSITKTDSSTTATAGTTVSYTLGYSNAGPSSAATVVLTETVPAGSTFNAGASTAGWVCTPNGNAGSTCTLAIGTVANAGSGSATFAVTLGAGATGSLGNTATISSATTDPTPGNNSATDTDTIGQSADLGITKTNGVTSVTAGGSTTYTITASNAGPSNTTATVADTFPASYTATWTCVGAGGGACTAAGSGNISDSVNLPAGGSVTYTVSGTISAGATGTLSNTATVTGAATDPTPGNNSATDADPIGQSADLGITKTDGVTSVTAGGSTTYTITASNAGPSNTTATVADTFPASYTATWTCVGAGGGTCTAAGSGNISDSVTLPAGGSVTYTVSGTISAGATGTLSNTATVTGAATDPTPGNNSATDTDTITASADLSITKTDGVTTVTAGGSTTYTITASNAGPSNTTATVADTFPASFTGTWTCVGAGGGTCTAAGAGNINDSVNLPAGGSVTYTVSGTISAGATGTLSNTATISSATTDPTPGNNSATDTDTITASANLGITKTDGVTTVTAGGSTTYTITASNVGPSNTTATVADTFPASFTGTWTCVGAGGGTCTAAGSGNINDAVTLPSGGSVTYTVSGTISASATGTLSNTATVTGAANDPTPGNNSATDTDTIGQSADLAITKTDGVTTVTAGGSTTYTITASNAGPSNTTATVADTFPAAITGVINWTCTPSGGATCTLAGSGNLNQPVTLPAGGSVTYTVPVTISASATGTLSNTATVTGAATDPTPGNNSATDTDTIIGSADLSITKTDGVTSVTAGGSTTYTITASNAGPSNTTATVADTFPASFTGTWTCVGAGGGTCTAAGSGNISDSVTLPAGGSVTYTVSGTISAAATGSLVNTATVTGAATDPTPGNNSATDTDTITASANLGITKTDGVAQYLPGGTVTYTITASNAGPSNVPSASIVDNFPAQVTGVTWTCVGAGGGTCNANGVGNINETANLPAGGSVTFTAIATISGTATGSMANTATVSSAVTDPTPGNNSATDTDTLAPASIQFSSATYREDESQTANITIRRTIDSSGTSTVLFSATSGGGNPATGGGTGTCGTAGIDFETVTNKLVTFNPTETEKIETVKICGGDTLQEIPDETITVTLTAPTSAALGTPATATLGINDTASQFLQAIPHDPINMFFATVANPYPSQIVVAGAPNIVGTMRVTLYDVSHANPDNMDVLLVGPLGQKYLLVADTGGPFPIDPLAPVTLTFSDFAGGHLLDSGAWTTGQFLPTVCESNSVFAPTAPGGPYVTPNCTTANTLAQTMFGSGGTGFGLTNPNGTWSLYVRDDAGQLRPIGDDTANFAVGRIAGGWGLEFLAPTAADVSIGGRVLTSGGRGIRGAFVTVTGNSLVSPINVTTGVNGRYTVPGLTAGETYVVTVRSRRFFFDQPSRVITLNDNVADADFIGSSGTNREQ